MERCPNDLTQLVNILWMDIYYLFIKEWFLLILFEQVFFLFLPANKYLTYGVLVRFWKVVVVLGKNVSGP